MNCANVNIVTSDFSSFLSENTTYFDLIFIDGHHDGNALIAYIAQLKPFLTEESVLILDDIRWSASMYKAWEELKKDPFFHLSIDLFRCGMLAKRSHQQREHFMLRY
jgi:predicted O-methyltransferase YrrM